MKRRFTVLFTSAGRRVALLKIWRRFLGKEGVILAADMEATAPTLFAADKAYIVPRVTSPGYIERLQAICREQRVDLIIPLIDPELPVLARARRQFAQYGTTVLVSDSQSIAISDDKLATAQFLQTLDVPAAQTWSNAEALSRKDNLAFPLIIKPRRGSSGQGVQVCPDAEALEFYLTRNADLLAQELLRGPEITIDIMGDGQGNVLGMVARQRLKIRAGEVERGITIPITPFQEYVERIARAFKPYGPINLQCFLTAQGPVFTEINARFGGGYPLADAAGAEFPRMVREMVEGRVIVPPKGYKVGLIMARFDEAFFFSEEQLEAVEDRSGVGADQEGKVNA